MSNTKFLIIKDFYDTHGNMQILRKKGQLFNSMQLNDAAHRIYLEPLSSAKWAVKRTPENADVVNKWATIKFGSKFNGSNKYYVTSNPTWSIELPYGYTEISFDTFKEIVGIEEEKKVWTIEDVRNGSCAVVNDGTEENLNTILNYAYGNRTGLVHGLAKYYFNCAVLNSWSCSDKTELPTQSVKLFLQQIGEKPTEEWQPKYDEPVEVSDDGNVWLTKWNFIGIHPNSKEFVVYRKGFNDMGRYKHTRKPQPIEISMSEALEIIAQAKGINVNQIKIVE